MPSRLSVPYNPELALTSSFLDDDDEESPEPRTPTKRRRGGDVRVELNKPPNKSAKLPNKAKMGLFFRRSCGGKRLHRGRSRISLEPALTQVMRSLPGQTLGTVPKPPKHLYHLVFMFSQP